MNAFDEGDSLPLPLYSNGDYAPSPSNEGKDFFEGVPDETVLHIFQLLEPYHLLYAAQVFNLETNQNQQKLNE